MRVILRLSVALLLIFSFSPVNAGITISDARGEQYFAQPPERVVVLNWDLLEQLLVLDVVPLAAPNLSGYREWVVRPQAPDSIEEIGTRAEPNLEKIAQLRPDVIIAAAPQQDILSVLEDIAPVVFLPNFTGRQDAATTAISHLKTLGKLFAKQQIAEDKLVEIEQGITALKTRIESRLGPSLPTVVMRFSTPYSVFLYTDNSSTQYVIEKLGLINSLPLAARAWGIKQQRINVLSGVESGYVLYILPFPEEQKLQTSPYWQAMPFVRAGKVNAVQSVWNYGGAMSLLYMAEAITDSLLDAAAD